MQEVATNTIISIYPDISIDGVSIVVKTTDGLFWRGVGIVFNNETSTATITFKK